MFLGSSAHTANEHTSLIGYKILLTTETGFLRSFRKRWVATFRSSNSAEKRDYLRLKFFTSAWARRFLIITDPRL